MSEINGNTPDLTALRATTPERYSVQSRADDAPFAPTSDVTGAGLFWVQLGNKLDEEPPYNPIYPHWRDVYLRDFARTEAMLASAVYSMATRISGLNYNLNGPPRAKKYAQELLTNPGLGDSLTSLIQKLISDLHTSDNGAFMELWRAGNPLADAGTRPVLGFAHLDSRQCWRSFDPEFPVWYTNPITQVIRKIHRSRVVFTSDNPQPTELGRGIGFCATSRVLRMSRVFKNMQIFVDEKVGGRFTRAIGGVSGVTPQQLKSALNQNNETADAKGFVVYKDIPFLVSPSMEKGNEIKIMMQDLAAIPDGFVFRDNADIYAYILAFCFGVDAREFWPATSTGATKADATVQNMKAQGRGLGNDTQLIEGLLRAALPATVAMEFDNADDEQDKMTAEIHQAQANVHQTYFNMGAINAVEARALGIAQGILDGAVLANNNQPIDSDDNPDTPDDTGVADTTPDGVQPDAEETDVNTAKRLKDFDTYRRSARNLTRGLWLGNLSKFDFVDGMVSAITREFNSAWSAVEKDYGINPGERTQASQDSLDFAINTEIGYLTGFADAVEKGSKFNGGIIEPLLTRADMWANGYDKTYALAQTIIGSDKKFRWVRNPLKDSCPDCLQYDGMVFFGSQWAAAGVRPRSWNLNCRGVDCGCSLEDTVLPKTYGRVPPLIGHKHTEALEHVHA